METSHILVCFFAIAVITMGPTTNAQNDTVTEGANDTDATVVLTTLLTAGDPLATTNGDSVTEAIPMPTDSDSTKGASFTDVSPTEPNGETNVTSTKPVTRDTVTDQKTAIPTKRPDALSKAFDIKMRITRLNGKNVTFGETYEDTKSEDYKELSGRVCRAIDAVFDNGTYVEDYDRCEVTGFSKGSIVAALVIALAEDTDATAEELNTKLVDAFKNSDHPDIAALGVDTDAFEVTPVTRVTPDPAGLSVGAIVGIIVGSVAGAVLLVILIVFLIKRCKGDSTKVDSVEVAELQPEAKADSGEGTGSKAEAKGTDEHAHSNPAVEEVP